MLEVRTFVAADAGCYLDNHRGHYISRDAIEFAVSLGFIVGWFERWALDSYEAHCHEEDYPTEGIYELADEAVAWLNNGREERLPGQNFPPVIPDDHAWMFFDGDFGLYAIEDQD
jgi:hypothetical protein